MKPGSVAAVLLLLVACHHGDERSAPPPYRVVGDVISFTAAGARDSSVSVQAVGLAAEGRLSVTGRLVWDDNVTTRVFPPLSGRVERILADLGAQVGRGDLLATLASPDFGQAQSDAARAAADLTAAERVLARARQLLERGAAPRKDVEQAEAELARSRAEAERTRKRLVSWGGAETGAVDQDFHIVSPVAGLVVERNISPGQEVRPDSQTPLYVISDPRRLWVLLDVTERDLRDMSQGARLEIHTPAYREQSFSGRLDVLGATLDPASRTVRARGRVDNPDRLLKAEMYVRCDVQRAAACRRLTLPARAVIHEADQAFVFLEEGPGRYRRQAVSVGPESEGSLPVLSGLSEAAQVVTEGSLLLEAAWAEGKK